MTRDFQETLAAYSVAYSGSPFLETWIPQEKFIGSHFDNAGNFAISREDDGIYGIALGENPVIPLEWKNFSMESRGAAHLPKEFKAIEEWDCYWAPTIDGSLNLTSSSTNIEIDAFLKTHAPDSSVFPGNDEVLQWVQIHDSGQLVAVAALCRWESGRVVISSVATHTEMRGKGMGKALMAKCLIAGTHFGEKYLSLGVRHRNTAAQALYAATGFRLMHNFTYCERR